MPATPRPASALPSAATAIPASSRTFPSGRRRIVAVAITTAASVPTELPTIGEDAGREQLEVVLRGRDLEPATGSVSSTASITPVERPTHTSAIGAATLGRRGAASPRRAAPRSAGRRQGSRRGTPRRPARRGAPGQRGGSGRVGEQRARPGSELEPSSTPPPLGASSRKPHGEQCGRKRQQDVHCPEYRLARWRAWSSPAEHYSDDDAGQAVPVHARAHAGPA